ncbi:MAG: metal-dependent hydrolase [Chloroflexota bacterium]
MLGHTHALIGVTTVVGMQALTGFMQPHLIEGVPVGIVLNISVGIIGALLPDIDAKESSIKRELGLAGQIIQSFLRMIGVKHRGATHFGLTALLLFFGATILGRCWAYPDLGFAFGMGYVSHIVADSLTKSGVLLLWPFYPKSVHLLPKLLRIRTGSSVETLLFMVVAVCLVFLSPTLLTPEIEMWIKQIL